jgi:rod shape-determining protein MreC
VATLSSDSRPIIARGPSLIARLLFLGALSIAIMVLDHRQKYLDVARSWLSRGVYPLQLVVEAPFEAWDWITNRFADRERLKTENQELHAQLRVANLQLLRMSALAQENQQLRAIREASSSMQLRTLVAEIMRVDIDPYRHRVLLNHGAKDGLYKGQAVLDAKGVFGQLTRVGQYAAEALLITDAEHATPIRVNRTGLRSIAVGIGDFNKLSLPYITGDADIKVGDLLVTSGLGGIYPPGYPVAEVTSIKRDPAQTFATVEAKPLAAMERAGELMLVWFEPPATVDIDAPETKPAKGASKSSGDKTGATKRPGATP